VEVVPIFTQRGRDIVLVWRCPILEIITAATTAPTEGLLLLDGVVLPGGPSLPDAREAVRPVLIDYWMRTREEEVVRGVQIDYWMIHNDNDVANVGPIIVVAGITIRDLALDRAFRNHIMFWQRAVIDWKRRDGGGVLLDVCCLMV